MKKLLQEIARVGGKKGRTGYLVLCKVVEAAIRAMPGDWMIRDLCEEVGRESGKSGGAVYRALARTVREIWEEGDREELEELLGYPFYEAPSAKELVAALAQTLWCRETAVEYCLLESGLPKRYGIWCRAVVGKDLLAASGPFSTDREAVLRLVEKLNREKYTVPQFQELLMQGLPRDL